MSNIDFDNLQEDEDSEYILAEIKKLKEQNLTNNIDFEKALIEQQEIESKLNEDEKENVSKFEEINIDTHNYNAKNNINNNDDEEKAF